MKGRRAGVVQSSALMASSIFLAGTGYVTQAILARLLEPVDYGRFTLVLSLATGTAVLVTSGIPLAASRAIAAEPEAAGTIERLARRLLLAWTLLVIAGFAALTATWAAGIGRPDLQGPLVAALALLVTYAFAGYQWNVLIGHERFLGQAATSVAGSVAKVLAAVGMVLAGLGAAGAILGYAAAGAFQGLLAAAVHRSIAHGDATTTFDGARLRRDARVGLALSAGLAFLPALDLLVAGSFLEGEAVGAYAAASTAARLPVLLAAGVVLFLFPLAARTGGRPQELTVALAVTPVLLVTSSLALFVLRGPFLRIAFGPDYVSGGAPVLAVLAWAGGAMAGIVVYANLLYARAHGAVAGGILAGAAAFVIGAGAWAVGPLGARGPATTALLAMAAALATFLVVAHRIDLRPVIGPWLRALALGAFGLSALWLLGPLLQPGLLALVVTGIAAAAAALLVAGDVRRHGRMKEAAS